MISKYKFTQKYWNNNEESISKGIITIDHSITEEEVLERLNEDGLYIEIGDGISYIDIEYVNENYDITFEKI